MVASDIMTEMASDLASPSDEERLLAATRRVLSTPKAHVAVLLRLSLLTPPLPRPHHRRIARALLEDAAQHGGGETFDLRCGDMVLLCRASSHPSTDPALHPASLPHTLARLFRSDVASGKAGLTTVWMLERDGAALLAYATRRAAVG